MTLTLGWARLRPLDKAHCFEGAESLCKHVTREPEVALESHAPPTPCLKCVKLEKKTREGK